MIPGSAPWWNWKFIWLHVHHLNFQNLKEVLHESVVFTSSTSRFWGGSRTKASFSHLQLSLFEGSLARKLRFHLQQSHFEGSLARKLRSHIFHFQILKEVSHESFIFTTWTFKIWRKSCTKASFSHLPLPDFEGSLARKLHFHIFNFHFLKEVSHESFVFTSSTITFSGRSRTKASFSHLQLSHFGGSLARKLRFHIFNFQILKEVSHESFVFTSLTVTFWGSLARKLRFHIFHFHFLREGSHEMRFWKLAVRTKCCVLQDKTCPGRWMGKLVRRAVAEHARLGSDHGRIGPAVELTVQVGFADVLARSSVVFCNSLRQGCLARRLRA